MISPMTLSQEVLNVFPDNYCDAKKKLHHSLRRSLQVADIVSLSLDGTSYKNDQLSTEIIWLGPLSAERVVVLISATHGIEGFVGAAVQTDLILRMQQGYQLPEDTAVLVVFALNAYGFAMLRRCDEGGIDLNRNFIDFSQPLPVNEGYARLQEAIYCQSASQRHRLFLEFQQEWGQTAFEMAISGGQYIDPKGPFYGGTKPSSGRNTIEKIIERYQLAPRQLAVIDIHSGLGAYAHGEIINDHPLDSAGYEVANRWYGASVTAPAAGDSSSVTKIGLLDYHWHPLMRERGCFVTLEFGSYRTQDLFDVILEDHRSWYLGDTHAMNKSAAAMKEHFCPHDSYWRELVLVKSRQVIQQAIDGLQYE